MIKSLIYMSDLQAQIREDNQIASIKDIEKEIPGSKEPVSFVIEKPFSREILELFPGISLATLRPYPYR